MLMFQQLLENGTRSTEQRQTVAFQAHYDAVVLGGGTAGSIAAICLAKAGLRVLVVEKLNFLGGVHSGAMFHYYQGSPGGGYEAYDSRGAQHKEHYRLPEVFGSHPLVRMCVYEQALQQADAEISFDSALTGAYTQGKRVAGIRFIAPEGFRDVSADYFVDATGEAVLCRLLGAARKSGRAFDGLPQPFSNVRLFFEKDTGRISFDNIDAGYVRQEQPGNYAEHLVKSLNNPVYSARPTNQITLGMAPLLGVREGYTLEGVRRLNMDQALENRAAEPLFFSYSNIDNHVKDMAFESRALCDWVVGLSMWSTLVSVPIEKEILLPKAFDNVIAAGRIVSLDHDMASHTRMMRDCQKSGEAAAAILAEAFRSKAPLQTVPYEPIRQKLESTGCLAWERGDRLRDNPPPGCTPITSFPTTAEQIRQGLTSDRPGFAMLAAWEQGLTDALKSWLTAHDRNLQVNSALVLALCGEDAGLAILMETARQRDRYLPKTSKSYNSLRGISAVYALGRLHSAAAGELLLQMLRENETFVQDTLPFDKFIGHMQDYRFQYVSHLVRALLSIAEYHPELRRKLWGGMDEIVSAPRFTVLCTLKSNPGCLHDMTGSLRKYIQWRKKEGEKSDEQFY